MDESDEEEESFLLLCLGLSASATRMLMTCTWKYMDLETTENGGHCGGHGPYRGGGTGLARTGQTHRVCERSSRVNFQAKLESLNRERASLTSVSRGVAPLPPTPTRTVNRRTAPNVKIDNRGVKGVDTPVINESRLHGEKQEGHDGVADGELGGGPRHHVVTQLQASGPQEVVAEGFTDLVCRDGGCSQLVGFSETCSEAPGDLQELPGIAPTARAAMVMGMAVMKVK